MQKKLRDIEMMKAKWSMFNEEQLQKLAKEEGTTRGGEPHYAEALFSEIVALVSCNDISACLFVRISVCDLYAVYFGGV